MEFNKVIFRLKPVLTKSNIPVLTKRKIPLPMINQPALIFDHNLNKVINYDNMSNESIQSFDLVFNNLYKSNIQTKFNKFNQFDLTNKFIGSNQIDHIKYSDIDTNTDSKIRCYLLDSAFIKSSIVIDRNLNIYHQILNLNNTIDSDNDTNYIFDPYLAI